MSYKLTIDANLMDQNLNVLGMEQLKKWKASGHLDFVVADQAAPKKEAYGWPGAPPKPPEPSKSNWSKRSKAGLGKIADSGKACFTSVAAILFSGKDPQKLSMGEINNIAHLIKHHSSKNEIFVTGNTKSFIEDGRRERLKNSFGIIVMTPAETVQMLGKMENWTTD